MHEWHLRNPDGAAAGMEFATGRMDPHDHVLAHALPKRVDVDVRDDDGKPVARGRGLQGGDWTPMARLDVHPDGTISRVNVWPDESDIGKPVILAGGEIGILTAWWNAEDQREWRWSIELYNHR